MSDANDAARLQHGVRPDVRAGADLALADHRVLDDGVVADDAVDQAGVGPDLAPVADDGAALQHRARVQGDVAAEADGGVDEGLARVEHRDALQQPAAVDPAGAAPARPAPAASGR